ncbi:hypothetical protein OHS58_07650 [Amycolatopsis sp. NBC_00348]|uniref:hypothetical protein n=1 Tax=Amycolatopsis sp. NBC_00348 TaxID=2975956 RepID=UPI002E25A4E6
MSDGNYAILGDAQYPVKIWFHEPSQTMHLTCNDPGLTDEDGARPGFRVKFNANPRSADYNPATFNRLARYLREHGKPAPDAVALHPRDLPLRDQVIEQAGG